ncbi:hypothetical protein [Streptomyces sp. HPF1205]|uniref:hypothetical protein n=1 Tax=Streptomyces sp. HPF1205 TaxID=2873262 RepID=UPI001CED98A5|nr:hypothetical protein [Streptomyces sp. HPF1205]
MDNSRAVTFTAVYAVLTASHEVADHWVQIDTQAGAKGKPGRAGIRACSAHVATYAATQAAALWAANRVLRLGVSPRAAAAGLAASALTHYVADRQGGHWRDERPRGVVRLAAITGHAGWLARDPGAGYLLDQSWHKGWIAVAAAVTAARKGAAL